MLLSLLRNHNFAMSFAFGTMGRCYLPPPVTGGNFAASGLEVLPVTRTSTEHGVRFELETSCDAEFDDAKSDKSHESSMSELRFVFPPTETIEQEFVLLADACDELFSRVEALLVSLKAQKK